MGIDGGVYLEYLILSLLGGVVLFGIFFVLPFKLSPQLKIVYIIFSILYSNLFIFGLSIFEVWQIALITILLIFLTAYFLMKSEIFATLNRKRKKQVSEEENVEEQRVDSQLVEQNAQVSEEKEFVIAENNEATLQVASEEEIDLDNLIKEQIAIQEQLNSKKEKSHHIDFIEQQDNELNEREELTDHNIVSLEDMSSNELETLEEAISPVAEIEVLEVQEKDISELKVEDSDQLDLEVQNDDEATDEVFDFLEARTDLFAELEEEMAEDAVSELEDSIDFTEAEPLLESNEDRLSSLFDEIKKDDKESVLNEKDNSSVEMIEDSSEKTSLSDQVDDLTDFALLEELEEIEPITEMSETITEIAKEVEEIEVFDTKEEENKAEVDTIYVDENKTYHEALEVEEIQTIENDASEPILETAEQKETVEPLLDENDIFPLIDEQTEQQSTKEMINSVVKEAIQENVGFAELEESPTLEENLLVLDQKNEQVTTTLQKRINRVLLESLVDQLNWYKEQLSAEQYEGLVKQHLHVDLNDLDYYTFASLLRDYYIETRQHDKLSALLYELQERYEHKPIIKQEISFFLEKFFEKQ